MRAIDLVGGTEIIPSADCAELLRANHLGRVGVVLDGKVEIFPVNYTFDGQVITFATNEGRKLQGIRVGDPIFEVDCIDLAAGAGWSVVVHGVVESIRPGGDRDEAVIEPWAGLKDFVVGLRPVTITGRRIVDKPSERSTT